MKEGTYTLLTVKFRYNHLLECTEDLGRHGKRLHTTKAQMLEPTYAQDPSLKLLIKPSQPILKVEPNSAARSLLLGEVANFSLRLQNVGKHTLSNLRVLSDSPHIVFESTPGTCRGARTRMLTDTSR